MTFVFDQELSDDAAGARQADEERVPKPELEVSVTIEKVPFLHSMPSVCP